MVHIPSKQSAKRNGNGKATPKATPVPEVKAETDVSNVPVADAAVSVKPVSVAITPEVLRDVWDTIAKGDTEISAAVEHLNAIKNEEQAGPVSLLYATLLPIYQGEPDSDGDYAHTLDEFFPRPVKDADAEAGTQNVHREFFDAMKPDATGELKTRKCNYFTEAWARTTLGKKQTFVIEQCGYMLDKGADMTKAQQAYRDMDLTTLANLREKTKKDKTRGRQYLRRAVGLWYVMNDLAEHKERAFLEPNGSTIEELSSSQYPMNLVDQSKGGRMFKPVTVTDILRMDVPSALALAGEKGNLFDQLVKQLSRQAIGAAGEGALFKSLDDCLAAIRKFNNFFDDKDNQTALLTLMAKGKDSDELVETYGYFVHSVKANWNSALDARYTKILNKQIEAGNVPAAAPAA